MSTGEFVMSSSLLGKWEKEQIIYTFMEVLTEKSGSKYHLEKIALLFTMEFFLQKLIGRHVGFAIKKGKEQIAESII